MGVDNSRYVDHNVIMATMSLYVKDKPLNALEIMNWCQEAETKYIKDPLTRWKYLQIPLTVTEQNMALLPCNVYRVLDVYTNPADNKSTVEHQNTGAYLVFGTGFAERFSTIYINYEGTPIDPDTGVPLILKGHEKACEAYCVQMLYYSDYLGGRLTTDRWMYITQDFENKARSARNGFVRHMTRASLDKPHIIHGNMIRVIGDQALAHSEWTK